MFTKRKTLLLFLLLSILVIAISCNNGSEESSGRIQSDNLNPTSSQIGEVDSSDVDHHKDKDLPFSIYYRDSDGDGYGDPEDSIEVSSPSEGYVKDNTDCNDLVTSINPLGTEVCNGLDDDCNGEIDEGLSLTTFYLDTDGDGYGDPLQSLDACSKPKGYVTTNTDSDDTNSEINPKAKLSNSINDNCWLAFEPVIIDESLFFDTIHMSDDNPSYAGVLRSQEELDEIWANLHDRRLPVRPFPPPPQIDFDTSMLLWFASGLPDMTVEPVEDTESDALCISITTSSPYTSSDKRIRLWLWETCNSAKEFAFNPNIPKVYSHWEVDLGVGP
ncbi:MAG: hypothetical protein GY845_37125, partial [Planctomycetes bacterium]|nr:hypothetical protein [Planctomycetota bacterium]